MHFQDQFPNLGLDLRAAWRPGSAPPAPVPPEALPVPSDHRLRPHEHKRLAPAGPAARQRRPEDPIRRPETDSSPRALALEYEKLVAKSYYLGMELGSAPKETPERAERGQEGGRQHRNHVDPPFEKHQCLQGDRVLGRQCVQQRLACSVGGSPTREGVRSPVAWVAAVEEMKQLKPTDKAIPGMVSESPGRNESEPTGGLDRNKNPEAEPSAFGRRQHGVSQPDRCETSLRRGGRGSTVTRACQATGEAVLVPPRNRWSRSAV